MIKLSDIFEIKYGVNLELNSLDIDRNGIPFVARTAENNGVSAYVKPVNGINPNPANTISVSGGGSVCEAFLQKTPYYSGRDLFYLTPKISLSETQMLFYCACIRANKYKYNYGRQANKTLKDLLVPNVNEIPIWISQTNIEKPIDAKPKAKSVIDLNMSNWKAFLYESLFIITGTKTTPPLVLKDISKGNYPYVTTQATNNGVENFYDKYTEIGNVLTIDSAVIGYCSYQKDNFLASDHVEKLIPKFNMNQYIAMFLTTLINLEQYRYNYGRKCSQHRLKRAVIKLPTTLKGEPDWQFMESYIKSLPYSSALKSNEETKAVKTNKILFETMLKQASKPIQE